MFHALTPLSLFVGPFFLYMWIWFSNNCIHNAFLAMVEDGYILQSRESTFSWLTDDLKDPDENKIIGDDDSDDNGPGDAE